MRILGAVSALVLVLCGTLLAQNRYTLEWDQNDDAPTGYFVYDNGARIAQVGDSAAPSLGVSLPVDDFTLHTYGVTAFRVETDGTVLESPPGTVLLQQPEPVPTPLPTPEPAPEPVPTPTPAQPESTDGTLLPPATQIVDFTGAVWTISTGGVTILRNGIPAGTGLGSKLLYLGRLIYTLGLDNNWWIWGDVSGWTNIGSIQPGTPVPVPTPTPVPQPPPVPTWKCNIPATVGSYANGDDKVTLRCPKAFPGVKGNSVTVSVP